MPMKFMLTFTMKLETRDAAFARFGKTQGRPPKGVTLLGRWMRVDLSGGYDLLESDDPTAITEFALAWSDLLELSVVPVVEDQGLNQALARAGKQVA
jgi:hypothetical protein